MLANWHFYRQALQLHCTRLFSLSIPDIKREIAFKHAISYLSKFNNASSSSAIETTAGEEKLAHILTIHENPAIANIKAKVEQNQILDPDELGMYSIYQLMSNTYGEYNLLNLFGGAEKFPGGAQKLFAACYISDKKKEELFDFTCVAPQKLKIENLKEWLTAAVKKLKSRLTSNQQNIPLPNDNDLKDKYFEDITMHAVSVENNLNSGFDSALNINFGSSSSYNVSIALTELQNIAGNNKEAKINTSVINNESIKQIKLEPEANKPKENPIIPKAVVFETGSINDSSKTTSESIYFQDSVFKQEPQKFNTENDIIKETSSAVVATENKLTKPAIDSVADLSASNLPKNSPQAHNNINGEFVLYCSNLANGYIDEFNRISRKHKNLMAQAETKNKEELKQSYLNKLIAMQEQTRVTAQRIESILETSEQTASLSEKFAKWKELVLILNTCKQLNDLGEELTKTYKNKTEKATALDPQIRSCYQKEISEIDKSVKKGLELINSNEISIVIYYYILISSMFMLRLLLV